MSSRSHLGESSLDAVLCEVIARGPLSRIELTRRLDLSKPSLTRLVHPLLQEGLLVETATGTPPTRGGRPPVLLDLAPPDRIGLFIGLTITSGSVIGVLTDARANVVTTATQSFPTTHTSDVADTAGAVVSELAARTDTFINGVGVAVSGLVDPAGTVVLSRILEWEDVRLADELGLRTDLPITVDNDVQSLLELHHWFGTGHNTHDFALVTLGTGIGNGLVRSDRVARSADSGLGLLGHLLVSQSSTRCWLGHQGCASALLTSRTLTRQLALADREFPLREPELPEILRRHADGDPLARALVDSFLESAAHFVATVADASMVNDVVVAGECAALLEVGWEDFQDHLGDLRNPAASPVTVSLRPANFLDWARGASTVAIRDWARTAATRPQE